MKQIVSVVGFVCLVAVLMGSNGSAAPIANCDASFTTCFIPENVQLMLPFTAIAGDVLVVEPVSLVVSDVFRISNNVINTGGGTGLGNLVFLFSSDEITLPPSLSANVQSVTEPASGYARYTGNGTTYVLGVPEPSTFVLLGAGMLSLRAMRRTRRSRSISE